MDGVGVFVVSDTDAFDDVALGASNGVDAVGVVDATGVVDVVDVFDVGDSSGVVGVVEGTGIFGVVGRGRWLW